jgi:hypothetical protein
MSTSSKLKLVDKLLMESFGDWRNPSVHFPLPMPANEAGPSPSGQRRYLWTDAFGICTFISQSLLTKELSKFSESKQSADSQPDEYLIAAEKLIIAVYDCLGNPRSDKFPMEPDTELPNACKGLRIGKTQARTISRGGTDMGMSYDGMYYHYLAQFIFAVQRYCVASHNTHQLQRLVRLIKQIHPAFLVPGQGYRWKVNVDLSPIPTDLTTRSNHDAVTALVVYTLVNGICADKPLETEIADLQGIVETYYQKDVRELMQHAMDPLGLGLELWSSQWLEGAAPTLFRDSMIKMAQPIAQNSIAESPHSDLNFRLYGAVLGLQLVIDGSTAAHLTKYAEHLIKYFVEEEVAHAIGENEHSTINKVMFAAAVNPLAYKRQDGDAVVTINV